MNTTLSPEDILKRVMDSRLEMLRTLSQMTMNLLGPLAPEDADEAERLNATLESLYAAAAEFRKQAQCFEADIVRFGMLAGVDIEKAPEPVFFESPPEIFPNWRQVPMEEIKDREIGHMIRNLLDAHSHERPEALAAAVESKIHQQLKYLKEDKRIYDFAWHAANSDAPYAKSLFVAYNPSMESTGWLFGVDADGSVFVKYVRYVGPAPHEKQWQDLPA